MSPAEWHLSDAPHITPRDRLEIDRHVRAIEQAREAGLTAIRDAWTANA